MDFICYKNSPLSACPIIEMLKLKCTSDSASRINIIGCTVYAMINLIYTLMYTFHECFEIDQSVIISSGSVH